MAEEFVRDLISSGDDNVESSVPERGWRGLIQFQRLSSFFREDAIARSTPNL